MRCRPFTAVARHCTRPRRLSTLHQLGCAVFNDCPVPTRRWPVHHCAPFDVMSAAFSTSDKASNGTANGDTTHSSPPLTPAAPVSPDQPDATATSAVTQYASTSPLPASSSRLPVNSAGGTASSFLHSLAGRLQGKRGEMAGRALSAPAEHYTPVSAAARSASEGFNLSKLQRPSLHPARPLVVLLACGSYSPVTSMHLLLFETAKNYLMYETAALDVVGGIISPVHDNYGKPSLVPAHHRISMTRSATASSAWITTSAWETLQPGWTTTCSTMAAYSGFLSAALLYPAPPRLVLLCGADLLESTQVPGLWAAEDLEVILGEYGVCVIERVGLDLEQLIAGDERLRRWRHHIWIVPQRVVNNVSSTVVRSMIREGLSIEYLVDAQVRDYIYQHALFGHDRERERRRQQRPVGRPHLTAGDKVVEEERMDGEGETEAEQSGSRVDGGSGAPVMPSVAELPQRNNSHNT